MAVKNALTANYLVNPFGETGVVEKALARALAKPKQ
jgi:hypothetical protein